MIAYLYAKQLCALHLTDFAKEECTIKYYAIFFVRVSNVCLFARLPLLHTFFVSVIPSFEKKFSIVSVISQVNHLVRNNIPFNHRSELLPCSWKVVQNVPTSTWNEKQRKH